MGGTNWIQRLQREVLDGMVARFPGIGLDRRSEFFVALFKEFIHPGSRVLDIGGGWGFYVPPLQKQLGCEVTVLDVVEPRYRKAPVVVYDGDTMPFPDGHFDVSILVTMLHHVPSPEKVLAEAKRVSRRLIVVEDLFRHELGRWWTIFRDSLYNFEFFGHPRNFRRKEDWIRSFERLGLEVHSMKEVYTSLLGMRILNGIFVLTCR